MAIICCLHKLRLLLSDWVASRIFHGMGLPSRSYGTYCFILLIQVTQIKLIMKLSLIELILLE